MKSKPLSAVVRSLLLVLSGCFGDGLINVKTPTEPAPPVIDSMPPVDCGAPAPSTPLMRRLSHTQFRYALEDLLGDAALASAAADRLIPDPVSLGFSNSASLLDVKPVLAQQYLEQAEQVAAAAVADLPRLLRCEVAQVGELACATAFIRRFVGAAYRGTLQPDEEARYLQRYQQVAASFGFVAGIEWVVATVLQAPRFLYRLEGSAGEAGSAIPVSPQELASRLSFFLWQSIPDPVLFAAAAEGRLQTAEDVEREARRMLADSRGLRVLHFFEEWLDLDKLHGLVRDPTAFPQLPADLAELFRTETTTFLKHVVFESDAKLATLLTADFTFVNESLAQHYRLPAVSGGVFQRVSLPPGRRGVWMQGGPLTGHDTPTRTSIVVRGMRVQTALLCRNIDAPPDDVPLDLGPVDDTASQAERLAQHRVNPRCAACHSMIDPLGQTFENVDAVGRLRTVDEAGNPISTAGALVGTRTSNGPVADGAELLTRIAASNEAPKCVTHQLFRYVHGREESPADLCARIRTFDRFRESGFDLRELLIATVTSDEFLFRKPLH